MMTNLMTKALGFKNITLVIAIVVFSFFHLGGCNDNGGGNNDPGPDPTTMSCQTFNTPCSSTASINGGQYYTCILNNGTCGVDLSTVLTQLSNQFTTVTETDIIWIEAWGGDGGRTDKSDAGGGGGGFAVTTTTISDIASINSNSTTIFYFIGSNGPNGGDHCGSTGGAATIVTLEDLVLNPFSNPTQTSPPIMLVAGGGGGTSGGNGEFGCIVEEGSSGGEGGTAIAQMGTNGEGAGVNGGTDSCDGGSMGMGGASCCNECGGGNETSGMNGFGGLGGAGGSGQSCHGPGMAGWTNTPVEMNFEAGQGGKGSSNTATCDAGGGGAGGGWGGGGGGGHGNENGTSLAGGGAASFAIASTHTTPFSPTEYIDNPCGSQGCVVINVVPSN